MYPKFKKKIEKKESQKERERGRRRGCVRGEKKILERGALASLQDLRKSNLGFSSEKKVKLVYATRAMRGYQNLGVSSNSMR